jgi:curli biogenesis system outer membrane secretion channel CsgG
MAEPAPVSAVSAGQAVGPADVESPPAASLTEALYQSYGELSGNIPGRASVAVISIASASPAEGEFALEELTLFFVNSRKYSVVDRRSLDLIRAEQDFQLSGEVDDDTAVSVGRFIGAAVVITGSVTPYGAAKYLRLKALDVETGEILAMVSRRFTF